MNTGTDISVILDSIESLLAISKSDRLCANKKLRTDSTSLKKCLGYTICNDNILLAIYV